MKQPCAGVDPEAVVAAAGRARPDLLAPSFEPCAACHRKVEDWRLAGLPNPIQEGKVVRPLPVTSDLVGHVRGGAQRTTVMRSAARVKAV